jgi:hypothetical protein
MPINTPAPPPPSPFASLRVHRLAAVESLDGAPQSCRGLRPNSPSPVSPAFPSISCLLPLILVHVLKSSTHPILQPNDASIVGRRSPTSKAPPAALYFFIWKQSRWRFTLSSSPRRSGPCHSIAVVQDPLQPRRSSMSGHISGDHAGTLASTGEPLPLRSYPLDLDLTTLIESLTEPVWDDLIHPDLLKSNGLSS